MGSLALGTKSSSMICHPEFWRLTVNQIWDLTETHEGSCLIDPELFHLQVRKDGTEVKSWPPSLWCDECRRVVHKTQTRIGYWNMDEVRRFCALTLFLETEPDQNGEPISQEFTCLDSMAFPSIDLSQKGFGLRRGK